MPLETIIMSICQVMIQLSALRVTMAALSIAKNGNIHFQLGLAVCDALITR